MSYSSPYGPSSLPHASQSQHHYGSFTPPPPPPKPAGPLSNPGTPTRGPPLPPPPPHPIGDASSTSIEQSRQGQPQESAISGGVLPPQPGWLPSILHDLSTQDLHELLENPSMQATLLDNPKTTHPSLPASQEPLHHLLDTNINLATNLQQVEAHLAHQRSATQQRLLSLRALEQQHRAKIAETEDTLRGFSPMALYQRLNASVQEQDALVKGIEDSFLEEGGMASEREIADFIRRVRDAKRTAFLRTERKERWDEGRVGGWR